MFLFFLIELNLGVINSFRLPISRDRGFRIHPFKVCTATHLEPQVYFATGRVLKVKHCPIDPAQWLPSLLSFLHHITTFQHSPIN
jgi:hypothetical protein